jgi:2-iminobutanoate/2-iminopropanoate deaminase
MKQAYTSIKNAPEAVGPYSIAVATDNLIFTSGQLPIDVKTGEISGETPAEQAKYALDNLQTVIQSLGSDMENVIKVNVFITDMDSFGSINEVYAQYFKVNCPARSCVEVSKLPKGALVEIEAIALIKK